MESSLSPLRGSVIGEHRFRGFANTLTPGYAPAALRASEEGPA